MQARTSTSSTTTASRNGNHLVMHTMIICCKHPSSLQMRWWGQEEHANDQNWTPCRHGVYQNFCNKICYEFANDWNMCRWEFFHELQNKDIFHGIFIGEGIKVSDVGKIQGRANRVKSSLAKSANLALQVSYIALPSLGGKSFWQIPSVGQLLVAILFGISLCGRGKKPIVCVGWKHISM